MSRAVLGVGVFWACSDDANLHLLIDANQEKAIATVKWLPNVTGWRFVNHAADNTVSHIGIPLFTTALAAKVKCEQVLAADDKVQGLRLDYEYTSYQVETKFADGSLCTQNCSDYEVAVAHMGNAINAISSPKCAASIQAIVLFGVSDNQARERLGTWKAEASTCDTE